MIEKIDIITGIKGIWYIISLWLFEYLNIPTLQFTILWLLMIVDFFAGVSKQFVIDPKWITSYKAWIWIMKKVWTLISIITIWLMLKWIGIEGEKYVVAFCSLLIMAEWYSVIQNIYTILTGKVVAEFDAVAFVFKKVWQIIQSAIEQSLDSNKK